MNIAPTLLNHVHIDKSWWDLLGTIFSNRDPLCAEHAVIAEHYRQSYSVYKQLDLLSSQWLAAGCSKNVFLVHGQHSGNGIHNRFLSHYLGKVDWKPRFPVVVKLCNVLQALHEEQLSYQQILGSPYHDCVLPHKFFQTFSVSPYAPQQLPLELCDPNGMHLPKHLVKWHLRGFWFERSRRYGDSKSYKNWYKLKLFYRDNFTNICMYKGYPRLLDLGDIYGL